MLLLSILEHNIKCYSDTTAEKKCWGSCSARRLRLFSTIGRKSRCSACLISITFVVSGPAASPALQLARVARDLPLKSTCRTSCHSTGRELPSIAAIVQPGSSGGFQKLFFGKAEIAIPVYGSIAEATRKHQKADVFINYASFRR